MHPALHRTSASAPRALPSARVERISSGTAAPEIEGIALARGVVINSIESRYINKIKARTALSTRRAFNSIPLDVAPLKAYPRDLI